MQSDRKEKGLTPFIGVHEIYGSIRDLTISLAKWHFWLVSVHPNLIAQVLQVAPEVRLSEVGGRCIPPP